MTTRGADDWALYAAHRAQLTEAVRASAPRGGASLCVLGAGRCNDLDLVSLLETFSEIHLVDLDASALASAVARQPEAARARLHRHGEIDLSGLSPRRLKRWKRGLRDLGELETAAAAGLAALLGRLGGPFDVVASTCVLTQMGLALRQSLGERHPALDAARLSLVRTHLSTLLGLTANGGTALFATDMVSSSHYPLATLPAERDLREVMRDVPQSGACYWTANPEIIGRLLSEVGTPELLAPWLWTGPLARTYLVYAMRLRVPVDTYE